MPWRSTNPVNERMRFVVACEAGLYSMTELCQRYGISRETGYTWLRRYRAEGPSGLEDRSHRPMRCPHRVAPVMEALLLAAKRAHPTWGPRKLRDYLDGE